MYIKHVYMGWSRAATLVAVIMMGAMNGFAQPYIPEEGSAEFSGNSRAQKPAKLNPNLPNVLIIGDSISIGYTEVVSAKLAGKANVIHNPGNAQGTKLGLEKLKEWLGDTKWDVIHFNWGLHDLKRVKPETGENFNDPNDPRQADLETYAANLEILVKQLKATGAKLIFATTTPFPAGVKPFRLPEDAARYNAAALGVIRANNIQVNDLHELVLPKLNALQKRRNVHFNEEGSKVLGEQVAEVIQTALGAVNPVDKKPNVIYILADDLGYGDLSCYGQKKLQTPNIDHLASEGMKFTDHYSGSTVCSPSRACLMTGQHPGRVHCRGNGDENSYAKLDPAMTTLPRLFKNAGYATGAFGKWGLGDTTAAGAPNPLTHGFDTFSGWKNQTIAHTYYPKSIVRDGQEEPLRPGTHIHSLIMDDAFSFIEKNAESGTPFFCYIPTAIPHAAMHAPADFHEKWRKVFPQFDKKIGKYKAGPEESCPPVQNPVAAFAAMMETLDGDVGRLLALLKKLGIDDNTLILFASDNGSHNEGGHDPEFWDSNGPFKGHKRDLYEGGIRSPFLARWPARTAPGSVSAHPGALWDVLPTMAELTDQPVPEQVNGLSFLPTLVGDSAAQKQPPYLYWEHPQTKDHDWAVRAGPWKGVFRGWKNNSKKPNPPRLEIYNLESDPGETTDLAAAHPEIVERLQKIRAEAHREPTAN